MLNTDGSLCSSLIIPFLLDDVNGMLSLAGWEDIDLDARIDVIFDDCLVFDTLSNWCIRPEWEENRNFKDLGGWWSVLVGSDRKMGVECLISLFSGQITSIIDLMLMQLVNNRFNLWWLSGQGTSLLLRGGYEIMLEALATSRKSIVLENTVLLALLARGRCF